MDILKQVTLGVFNLWQRQQLQVTALPLENRLFLKHLQPPAAPIPGAVYLRLTQR